MTATTRRTKNCLQPKQKHKTKQESGEICSQWWIQSKLQIGAAAVVMSCLWWIRSHFCCCLQKARYLCNFPSSEVGKTVYKRCPLFKVGYTTHYLIGITIHSRFSTLCHCHSQILSATLGKLDNNKIYIVDRQQNRQCKWSMLAYVQVLNPLCYILVFVMEDIMLLSIHVFCMVLIWFSNIYCQDSYFFEILHTLHWFVFFLCIWHGVDASCH